MSRTRYLVIGMGRSGTTVVHTCLRGHPRVSATNDELRITPLFDAGLATYTISGDAHLTPKEKSKGIQVLFDAITSVEATEQTLATGAKVALWTLEDTSLLVKSLQQKFRHLKIIFVDRDDLVAQYASSLRARATKQYHQWKDQDIKHSFTTHVPLMDFLKYACTCHEIKKEISKLEKTHQCFRLIYEQDILTESLQGYYNAFDFLGLPHEDITWLSSRKVAPPPEDFVANYSLLVSQLENLRDRDFIISDMEFSHADNIRIRWKKVKSKITKISSRIMH